MTTLLGSKRWITAVAAAGALMTMSGCSAPADEAETAATTPETATTQESTTEPSPSGSVAPSPSGTPSATSSEEPTEERTEGPAETEAPTLDAAPPMAPAPSPPAAPGICTAAQLTGSVQDQLGGGAAGSVYRTLVLTNASAQTCTVQGYPGVSFVDAAGTQLGAPAARDGSAAVPVTVDPGSSVSATLQQTNAQNYGENCDLTPASGLRVYPPGATDSLILPQELPVCSADSIVLMHVGTLQPGS